MSFLSSHLGSIILVSACRAKDAFFAPALRHAQRSTAPDLYVDWECFTGFSPALLTAPTSAK
jgi:hypothetical protein